MTGLADLVGSNWHRKLRALLTLCMFILGRASPHCFGIGHARVTKFLMSSLRYVTPQQRYESALLHLSNDLQLSQKWPSLVDRGRGATVAHWMVEAQENDESKAEHGLALSALGRIEPGESFKLPWKVYDVWTQMQPAQQAPAYPPEVIEAIAASLFVINQPGMGVAVMLCYCGLLRISEALNLRWSDVVFTGSSLVLCLGQTKRGLEQKGVLTSAPMIAWLSSWRTAGGTR
eukprot:TRINITY_DN15960_c0_g1_i1.p1 TRINITY_DN15960_c0_g1~~TRINITY_DN15960_c0_g1_i1.p1  ORF type:complete len:232 (+),score=38.90 TRINITY_DN15960_c0_g1_i1:531-1226(+)